MTMTMLMSRIVLGIGGLAVLFIGLLTVISYYFYYVAIKRNSKAFLSNNQDLAQIHGEKEMDDQAAIALADESGPTR